MTLTNRDISTSLGTNLAKWKRWSREFLPPDPSAGMQSGRARQYSPNEAFIVFLGGHLVGDMKFSVPEARQILATLQDWLASRGLLPESKKKLESPYDLVEKGTWQIRITKVSPLGFDYYARGTISTKIRTIPGSDNSSRVKEEYIEDRIIPNFNYMYDPINVRYLNISYVLLYFNDKINQTGFANLMPPESLREVPFGMTEKKG